MSKNKEIKSLQNSLDFLYAMDYKERPVDIIEFLCSDEYLGKSTEQGRKVFPVWKESLEDMFSNTEKYEVALTGAIGTGKSNTALLGIAFCLQKILKLKDMRSFFGKMSAGGFAVSFFSLTKTLASTTGFSKLQDMLQASPWFMKQGIVRGTANPVLHLPHINWTLMSPYARGFGVTGADIIAGLLDEVNDPMENPKQRERVIRTYQATLRRFETRFAKRKNVLTKMFIVASAEDESSFLESYLKDRKNSTTLSVYSIPLWKADPTRVYCGKNFTIALGDKFKASRILETKEEIEHARLVGSDLLEVPIEHKEVISLDIVGGLRDICGISVFGKRSSKLIPAPKFYKQCEMPQNILNSITGDELDVRSPFKVDELEIGLEDDISLFSLLNLKMLRDIDIPRFIHLDAGKSHDRMGIAMCHIAGYKVMQQENEINEIEEVHAPVVLVDFMIRIKAKDGDEIPVILPRKFIYELMNAGVNIAKVTADSYLSDELRQVCVKLGLADDPKSLLLSVDRFDTQYLNLKTMMIEQRIFYYYYKPFQVEVLDLEHDKLKRKVDHPSKNSEGAEGTKDISDAVAGCTFKAIEIFDPSDYQSLIVSLVDKDNEEDEDIKGTRWLLPKEMQKRSVRIKGEGKDDLLQIYEGI